MKMKRSHISNTALLLLGMVFTPVLFAQPDLQACAVIESSQQRLSCFDELARVEQQQAADEFARPKATTAAQRAPLPSVTAEQARASMGAERIQTPSSSELKSVATEQAPSKSAKQQAKDGIVFTVQRSKKDGVRRQLFYMEDGQIWRELEPSRLRFPKKQSFKVVIDRGSMGDYRLKIDGKGLRTRVVRLK